MIIIVLTIMMIIMLMIMRMAIMITMMKRMMAINGQYPMHRRGAFLHIIS